MEILLLLSYRHSTKSSEPAFPIDDSLCAINLSGRWVVNSVDRMTAHLFFYSAPNSMCRQIGEIF
jgi:hypothetical protein